MPFADLSNELVEATFQHTLDGPSYHSDRSMLQMLARVCSRFHAISRRLLLARIVLVTPKEGQRLLQTLARNRNLAACVRSLTIREGAFASMTTFSDISQDDLLRLCPNVTHFDSLRFRHIFESFPTTLRTLTISAVDHFASLWNGYSIRQHLKHLEHPELDFVTVPAELIEWLAGPCSLVELKIWMITDPLVCVARDDRQVACYKPPFLPLQARPPVAGCLFERCLASHVYFPPPIEVLYPPGETGLAIREIRRSHIKTAPEDMSNVFFQLAPDLYTLALHRVTLQVQAPWPQFRSLRRLEYGKQTITREEGFVRLGHEEVQSVRVHAGSGGRLQTLLNAIEQRATRSSGPLRTLELVGTLDEVGNDWTSGVLFDKLVSSCSKDGTQPYINGRTFATLGGMWTALQAPKSREEIV
ncbi:hypothetical protein Rt10032_c12g4825 [Rhodotorula toruloides]|uniref:F-box domain-containing protein n=1 Tax=Rhodotorula toruloides TaxID=5286 RepID=A0A511KK97_RHOTO|nr:hypothetical protein Rt10032_c12g4825 [Rhodotorula toruloides]